jgi:hypothetical protein
LSTSTGNRDTEAKKAARTAGEKYPCFYHKQPHLMIDCPWFLALAYKDRITEINKAGLCQGCFYELEPGHKCRGKKCRFCGADHHWLLCGKAPVPQNAMEHSIERFNRAAANIDFYFNVARLNVPSDSANAQYAIDTVSQADIDESLALEVSYSRHEQL